MKAKHRPSALTAKEREHRELLRQLGGSILRHHLRSWDAEAQLEGLVGHELEFTNELINGTCAVLGEPEAPIPTEVVDTFLRELGALK